MQLLTTNLFEHVLMSPAKECDELCIVSGYASPAFVQTHYYQLKEHHTNTNIKINLIVGMVRSEGISSIAHESFVRLVQSLNNRFHCYYVVNGQPTHTKLYVWLRQGIPAYGYVGSPNYSSNGFFTNREAISTSAEIASYAYYCQLLGDAVSCLNVTTDKIKFRREKIDTPVPSTNSNYHLSDTLEVSLLDAKGEMHARSGLNWGQRDGRNKNQAYIPVNGALRTANFFPPKGIVFTVITDDNVSFELVVAQDNDKALETPQSNAILGAYFRRRLNLQDGAYVTKNDLLAYGRTSVLFKKLNDELYFMDFSKTMPH